MKYVLFITVFFWELLIPKEKFILLASFPVSYSFFYTDNLGNIYFVKGDVLEKYDSQGKFLKSYSNKLLGNITYVDVSNPFRVLVFYESFQQVIILDNMLVPSANTVLFELLGYKHISLVSSSHNNGMWIYDKENFQLIRIDKNFQSVSKSDNIVLQIATASLNPSFLLECNNKVFLCDTAMGILIFDIYGNYSKTIPITGLSAFQVSNDDIIYFKDQKLKSYNMKTLSGSEINLPTTDVLYARSEKEKLYLLKQKLLEIYHVKEER